MVNESAAFRKSQPQAFAFCTKTSWRRSFNLDCLAILQKMPRRNYRKRHETEESDDDQRESNSASEVIEERKEMQRFRKRQAGVSAVALALGKTLAPEEEVESDPFKLKTGGLVELNSLIQDRNRDREGEDKEKSINLGANFAAETNRRDEDTHMLKYIEEEMAKRKGVQLDKAMQSK